MLRRELEGLGFTIGPARVDVLAYLRTTRTGRSSRRHFRATVPNVKGEAEEVISMKKLSVRRLEPVKTSAAVACASQS
jgi:hypothetical protein